MESASQVISYAPLLRIAEPARSGLVEVAECSGEWEQPPFT